VGMGAEVVTNGALVRGARGFAGEVGRGRRDANGREGGCGRHGGVEALAGIDAMLHRAVPDKFPDRPLSGKDITDLVTTAVKRAETGDTAAIGAIQSAGTWRSEEHTSELQSRFDLVCRLLLEKKKTQMR